MGSSAHSILGIHLPEMATQLAIAIAHKRGTFAPSGFREYQGSFSALSPQRAHSALAISLSAIFAPHFEVVPFKRLYGINCRLQDGEPLPATCTHCNGIHSSPGYEPSAGPLAAAKIASPALAYPSATFRLRPAFTLFPALNRESRVFVQRLPLGQPVLGERAGVALAGPR